MDEIVPQNTLRETLEANVEAAEAGVLPSVEEARTRDEAGRFAKQQAKEEGVQAPVVQQPPAQQAQQPVQQPAQQARPTTWKKEYLPIYDKLAAGQPLTAEEAKKLADYTNQRENEYKTGVSTYRTEALQAKELQDAITPFLPDLQQTGMKPAQWIKELGQANLVLLKGNPQQKLQMLGILANRYGIPLAAAAQQQQPGGVPPVVHQLLSVIDGLQKKVEAVEGRVGSVTTFQEQVQLKVLENEVQKLSGNPAKYPHFEELREQMAQLLEKGLAPDLESAYDTAQYLNPEVRQKLLTSSTQPGKAQVAAQARARAVSPKSSTPSGQVKTGEAKDRRAILSEALDAAEGGRV